MNYMREFLTHRLILFLLLVWLASGAAFLSLQSWPVPWIALLLGLVLFVVMEYAVHRFILHQFPKLAPALYEGHVAHHRHPTDSAYLFGPVKYDAAVYILVFAIAFLITGSMPQSSAFLFGIVSAQLYYQWKHYVSHRPIVPVTPWGKWLKKKHLLHHYADEEAWYGVSNPIMDVIMKTNKHKSRR